MNIIIKKAAIRNSIFLYAEYDVRDLEVNSGNKSNFDAPIHEDLREAFRNLIPHLAFLCDQVENEELVREAIKNPENYLKDRESSVTEEFFKYYVNELTIDNKKNIVVISGNRLLTDGDVLQLNAPPIFFQSSKYIFIEELKENIELIKKEVVAYLEGKHAEKSQLEMFSSEEEEEEEHPEEPKAPKAKGPKGKKNNEAFVE